MKAPHVLICVTGCVVGSVSALSDRGLEAAKQLDAAMIAEVEASDGKVDGRNQKDQIRLSMMPRVKAMLASPDGRQNLDETLAQLSGYFRSDAVLKNVAILQDDLAAEREARNQAIITDLNAILSRSAKTVREARKPSDIDAIIADLGRARQRQDRGSNSEEVRTLMSQIGPTLEFATQWQNYLSAAENGDSNRAMEVLRNLSNSSQVWLVPRSEILGLLANPKPVRKAADKPDETFDRSVEAILERIQSLDDIGPALIDLSNVEIAQRYQGRGGLAGVVSQSLSSIDQRYQDFKAGLPTNLELTSHSMNSLLAGNDTIARLRAQLMMLQIPRFVGAPEGTMPKNDENVLQFLERIGAEARDRGELSLALRVREAQRMLQRANNLSPGDNQGITSFIAGQNQEAAGQFSLAVVSYQSALRSGSELVPAKFIGERLAALKSERPADYESGMALFLNPPMRPAFPPGHPGHTGVPGFPGQPDGQPGRPAGATLLIPPAPTASPSAEGTGKDGGK